MIQLQKNLSPRVGKSCRLPCNARALYASHHQVHSSPLPQGSPVLARTQSSRVVSLFYCLPRKPCAATRDRQTGPSPESYSVSKPVLRFLCFAVVWRTTGPSSICCCSSLWYCFRESPTPPTTPIRAAAPSFRRSLALDVFYPCQSPAYCLKGFGPVARLIGEANPRRRRSPSQKS